MSSTTVEKLVGILTQEVGYHEGRKNGHWNNKQKYSSQVPGLAWSDFQAWCATFVSWAYLQTGLRPNVDFPVTASVATARAWYRAKGRISDYPVVGAQVFYSPSHTGIVIGYDADHIIAIEGNTNDSGSREGDGVYRKVRLRRAAGTLDYGLPFNLEGMRTANPAGDRRLPAPRKPKAKAGPNVEAAIKAVQKIKSGPLRDKVKAAAIAQLRKLGR